LASPEGEHDRPAGTAVVGSTSTEQTGRIAGAEQQQRVLEQAAAAGREDPLRWQIAFRPIVAATDALAWEKARTVLAKLEPGGPTVK
jgi:alkanesulfonate monooxygenase SsuD/methylene tetrahydromethanopterin reductase-like flavin-dependent oxidoreductase (luciferase family)